MALPIQFDWTLEAIPASEQSGQESVARVLEGFLLQGVGQHAGSEPRGEVVLLHPGEERLVKRHARRGRPLSASPAARGSAPGSGSSRRSSAPTRARADSCLPAWLAGEHRGLLFLQKPVTTSITASQFSAAFANR